MTPVLFLRDIFADAKSTSTGCFLAQAWNHREGQVTVARIGASAGGLSRGNGSDASKSQGKGRSDQSHGVSFAFSVPAILVISVRARACPFSCLRAHFGSLQ